jgi:non-heme Fe2+,alpha-ketoglutarate-dependent halogenase
VSDEQRLPAHVDLGSDPALARFWRDGYAGPFRVYPAERAAELLRRIRIGNQDRSRAVFDNDVNYDRHFDIPELAAHIGHPDILAAVQPILGPDVMCWRSEFFPKFPGSAATEWHQVDDFSYATGEPMLVPGTDWGEWPFGVTVWTAFTRSTISNGCLRVIPGSHRQRYYDERRPVSKGRDGAFQSVTADGNFYGYDFTDFQLDPDWTPPEDQAVDLVMEPGEAVVFTSRCLHASQPNTSLRDTRFAITARFVAGHVDVYPGWDRFTSHGGEFDLSSHGVVPVSGSCSASRTRVRTEDSWGVGFEQRFEAVRAGR